MSTRRFERFDGFDRFEKFMGIAVLAVLSPLVLSANQSEIAKWDPNMAQKHAVTDTNGVKWIDGKYLPIEGRMFDDVDDWYDRLPSGVTTNVNAGVRNMKHNSAGLQFRFATDSKVLKFRWKPYNKGMLSMDHMPSTGVSGIDVYRFNAKRDRWEYVRTGRIWDAEKGGSLDIGGGSGERYIVNLPLYNGIREFTLGIDPKAEVRALPPRKSGVNKPVVFYGTSITHGGCCSRPGLAFPSIVGRQLDVPIVNLGFSGSGQMELEMSEHLARIDASCYVLDCLWNMNGIDRRFPERFRDITDEEIRKSPIAVVKGRYENFIRNLRAKRPGVPIVMAEQCDVYCKPQTAKDLFVRELYEKLVAEGWTDLVYLPKTDMYTGDLEGTVDGCHPNDWGMMSMAKAFGKAVREALNLPPNP